MEGSSPPQATSAATPPAPSGPAPGTAAAAAAGRRTTPPKAAAAPPKPAVAATAAASSAPQPAPPALNLTALEQRLRDTRAIGVFTKLSLKNQVDDLLDQFRAYYKGRISIPLTDLRQRYDLLMMKVVSLLQDRDPPLASDIVASREAIWGILRDPQKFATI
jgi:hypothetical protein